MWREYGQGICWGCLPYYDHSLDTLKITLIVLCIPKQGLLHGLLVVEDKLSMAHGLENRVPFLTMI